MKDTQTTRRDFLKAMAGAAAVTALPGCLPSLPVNEGFAATAIVKSSDYGSTLFNAVESGMQLIPPPDVVGKRVLLKANLVDLPRDNRPTVTNPALIVAVAEAFRRRGAAEIIVGDGPALQRDAWEICDASGLTTLLRENRLPFVDLNHDDVIRTPNLGSATGLSDLHFASSAMTADVLVSIPKMKTHHWLGISLSLKSMFGTLSGAVYGWPRNHFHKLNPQYAVFDFNRTRSPDYCIVDGVVAMQGDGPIRGTALDAGVLVFGDSATAVDATCARIMQVAPERVTYLRLAAGILGPIQEKHIEQRGEAIASVARPFELVEHLQILRA